MQVDFREVGGDLPSFDAKRVDTAGVGGDLPSFDTAASTIRGRCYLPRATRFFVPRFEIFGFLASS